MDRLGVHHGFGLALATVAVLVLGASSASAAVTVGSPLAVPPDDSGSIDATYVQFAVPSGGAVAASPIDGVITSWRARGNTEEATPAQILLRVMRPAGADSFTAVSSNGASLPTSAGTHQFPARLAIRKGDFIGLTQTTDDTVRLYCEACLGTKYIFGGPFANGQTRSDIPGDGQVMVNATVEPDADNDGFGDETQDGCPTDASRDGACSNLFTFGEVKKNKRKGTAELAVEVPAPGSLELAGNGVKPGSGTATEAGEVKLRVKAKGKAKRKLRTKEKAKVEAEVTFTPTGGSPNTETKGIKLVKR